MAGLNTATFPAFIEANTEIVTPPLEETGIPPPFWAFCWPGGQALARHIIDNPDIVRGKSVLEFAAGGAVSGIAAARAGAASVTANDIDPIAVAAAQINAKLNGVTLTPSTGNLLESISPTAFDVILAGDIFYEQSPAVEIESFLRREAARGAIVLIGDPGRKYLPLKDLQEIARYDVPTSLELEDREIRAGVVWRVV